MAIQRDILRFTGKVGTFVGRKGPKGQYVASVYQPIVQQPNSDKQVTNRSAFTISSKVAAYLGVLGQQVLIANGFSARNRGELVAELMALTSDMVAPSVGAVLPVALPLVKVPRLNYAATLDIAGNQPQPDASGSINLNIEDDDYSKYVRRLAALIIYNEDLDQWRSYAAVLSASTRRITIGVPGTFQGRIHAYGYFLPVGIGTDESLLTSYLMGGMVGNEETYSATGSEDIVVGNFNYGQITSQYAAFNWQIGG